MAGFGPSKQSRTKKSGRKSRIDADALFQEALDHEQHGDWPRAEEVYLKIIKKGGLHSSVFLNLGDLYQRSGRLRQAISLYEQAVSINPGLPHAHMKLGALLKEIGDLDQARKAIMHTLLLKPDNPRALLNVMSVYAEEDLCGLKSHALDLVQNNADVVNDLDFVEFLSSLGESFCQDVLGD